MTRYAALLAILTVAIALLSFTACAHRVPDDIHRYRHPPLDTARVTCWADSHPNDDWPARADGQCFMDDAPWKGKGKQ